MTKKRRDWRRRVWLNEGHGKAAYHASITGSGNVDAYVEISDCSRQISLDFCVYGHGDESVERKLRKLSRLIKELQVFEAELRSRLGVLDAQQDG